jgi:hypothetical protein
VPSEEEIIVRARSAEEIAAGQPSLEELLRGKR